MARSPSATPTSGIILAGGRSRRMGRPKAWLDLGGEPALTRVAAILRPLTDGVVVVAAADQDLPDVDARIVRDRVPDSGPLPALALGLENITGSHAMVLACDTPLVRPGVLTWLDRTCRERDADAVVPIWSDLAQPLVAVYHHRSSAQLAALAAGGERRLRRIGDLPGVQLVDATELAALDPAGDSFRTMNTPAEYAVIRTHWPGPRSAG